MSVMIYYCSSFTGKVIEIHIIIYLYWHHTVDYLINIHFENRMGPKTGFIY